MAVVHARKEGREPVRHVHQLVPGLTGGVEAHDPDGVYIYQLPRLLLVFELGEPCQIGLPYGPALEIWGNPARQSAPSPLDVASRYFGRAGGLPVLRVAGDGIEGLRGVGIRLPLPVSPFRVYLPVRPR